MTTEPIEQEPPQDPPPQDPPQDPPELTEVEQEAQKYGWRPKADFDRDPDNWVDAEKFMSFPSTQNRVLKDAFSDLKSSVDRTVSERVGAVEGMWRESQNQRLAELQKAHEAELARVRAEQREAAAAGDVKRYDALTQQERGMQPPPKPAGPQSQADPAVERYKAENKWTQDPIMWQAAVNAVGNAPNLTPEQQLQLGERAVRQMFPDKFEAPKPPRQRVDGGGLGGASKPGKTFRDLPAEAKRQGKEFVEEGVFKTEEDYAKAYYAQLGGSQ